MYRLREDPDIIRDDYKKYTFFRARHDFANYIKMKDYKEDMLQSIAVLEGIFSDLYAENYYSSINKKLASSASLVVKNSFDLEQIINILEGMERRIKQWER